MSVLSAKCPHCGADSAMQVVNVHDIKDSGTNYDIFCTCQKCERAVIAHVVVTGKPSHNRQWDSVIRESETMTIAILPKIRAPEAPQLTPPEVENLFLQGDAALIGKSWDAAAMTFRKTLEVSLKIRWPDLKGSLADRIDKIAESHEITPALKEWAHAIRIDGNTAVHETSPTSEDFANNIRNFTELFLLYVFTLPAMLARRSKATGGVD